MNGSSRVLLSLLGLISLFPAVLEAQRGRGGGAARFVEAEKRAIAEPFKGVTTDGEVETDLFAVKSTGVSTDPVRAAAVAFLAGLGEEQRAKSTFAYDDDEWRRWANQHALPRQGVDFNELNEKQRGLALALLESSLSARGLKTTEDIMKLNHTIAELNGRHGEYGYGRWAYHLTVMGEPSKTEPWGWQLDGHHLVLNYFVLGDQVVMTPTFLGSEPVWADAGDYKGTIVLQEEQNHGLRLAQSLNKAQRTKAVLDSTKAGVNSSTEAFSDNVVVPEAGILYSELNESQQQALLKLLGLWVGHIKEGHATVKMKEISEHLDRTRFAWIGGLADDDVFYYRIQSPVVLVEFDHQRPIGLERTGQATRNHIHGTIRTPNGNDYGKDLLRQHLEKHHK